MPHNLFQGFSDDTEDSIKQHLNSEYAKIISDLLAKILNDSSMVPEMAEIQYYASDHRWMYRGLGDNLFKTSSPDKLNSTQEESMNQLGWEYLNQFTEQGQILTLDVKRVYLLTKEATLKNQNLITLGFNQQLSIAFAASSLEAQTREY